MTDNHLSRRQLLAGIGAAAAAAGANISEAAEDRRKSPFTYCLNTFPQEIETATKAGYDSIEPWVGNINRYISSSGSLKDIRKRLSDLGLTVESAISFFRWIVDDDETRAKGLEQAKREMDILAQIGGKRIAAPPAGATSKPGLDLDKAAERYRVLLELGDQFGVVPQVEVWGFSKNLHLLGQSMYVVIESGHPKACLLPDVFHIYKGGSDFAGLKQLSAHAIQVFHINDYPADPPREKATDRDRIYPGDGVAPLTQILRDMYANNSQAVLSLELFNPTYYKQEALTVAKTGLAKTRAAVNKALSSG